MPSWLKVYGDTEGPLGFPMKDAEAKALEEIIKGLPEQDYQRVVIEKAMTELSPGERADVSWITTEAIDRQKEVVLTDGFNDEQFKANPIVTINHDYTKHPVGRSLWRRKVRDGQTRGIKAKTVYPARPGDWNEPIWPPDVSAFAILSFDMNRRRRASALVHVRTAESQTHVYAFDLVQSGLMVGKSIGFLTLKAHAPTDEEVKANPTLKSAARIIDQWMLLEYCCTWLPINPEAITEAVSKSLIKPEALAWLGVEAPKPPPEPIIPHTTLEEIEKALVKRLAQIDTKALVDRLWKEGCEKARGRI